MAKIIHINKSKSEDRCVSLSNRQYAAAKLVLSNPAGISLGYALSIDQRSFGSLYKRRYISYQKNEKKFHITPHGVKALGFFENTNVLKETPSSEFSHYIKVLKVLNNKVTIAS